MTSRLRAWCCSLFLSAALLGRIPVQAQSPPAQRVVILKVDGLNADLLFRLMQQRNAATGKSRLPWLDEIFTRNGTTFNNFFVRGISLSAPSWSMLDTGRHLLIKGNVEYDRFTGRVYDYLNFFPFYIGYARLHQVDMPSVEVLDEAGVPLVMDGFGYAHEYQSFQLFQRGVRWSTLKDGLKRGLSTKNLLSLIEDPQSGLGLGEELARQTEHEMVSRLANPNILYLDFFTGEIDHLGHSVNDEELLDNTLTKIDALAGRVWNAIQSSPLANQTIFVMVSDHGMNNVPSLYSQTFSLPDLLNTPAGGAHHVVTNRHQLSNYKLSGLDPLVFRVINPSSASFYLKDQANQYPTAWLDLDGNERVAVGLRNSELNRIHILLDQLRRKDLSRSLRAASVRYLNGVITNQRKQWQSELAGLKEEIVALGNAIDQRQEQLKQHGKKWSREEWEAGLDKDARRKAAELTRWIEERARYQSYIEHLERLLQLDLSETEPFTGKISEYIPEMSLGDHNRLFDLQHYVAGLSDEGLVTDNSGSIDEQRSFRYIDYFPLLAAQRVRNNPQKGITPRPVDFVVTSIPPRALRSPLTQNGVEPSEAVWLYGDDTHQLIELIARNGDDVQIRLIPAAGLKADAQNTITWSERSWAPDLPLRLFEDKELKIPAGSDRGAWLSSWHSERDWFKATYACRYSNGVIGITEETIPPAAALSPGDPGNLMARLERRRRDLVQPDFEVFASDHWNFNVRNFNPGGNHGSFLHISTHSVWMMAGAGIPAALFVDEPYDSLNFANSLLKLAGKDPPLPGRVAPLKNRNH